MCLRNTKTVTEQFLCPRSVRKPSYMTIPTLHFTSLVGGELKRTVKPCVSNEHWEEYLIRIFSTKRNNKRLNWVNTAHFMTNNSTFFKKQNFLQNFLENKKVIYITFKSILSFIYKTNSTRLTSRPSAPSLLNSPFFDSRRKMTCYFDLFRGRDA